MKVCGKCRKNKENSNFAINEAKKDGLCWQCRDCQKQYHRKHYLKNKDRYRLQAKKQ